MANMRVVYDNAADRATITASTTAGGLVASNMQNDFKSVIWRSTAKTATLTMTWPSTEIIGVVGLLFANFTATATMRVQGYTETADSVAVFDTGHVLASPSSFGAWDWGMLPLGINTYTYTGYTYGVVWCPVTPVKKIVVTITDNDNTSSYVEVARCVTGAYWSPENNAEYGAEVNIHDTSKNERSDAGDLRTDRGTLAKTVAVDLSVMPATDRTTLWSIARGNGIPKPMFFSLSPESSDSFEEQLYQVFGKLAKQSAIKYQYINQFSSKLEIEEI